MKMNRNCRYSSLVFGCILFSELLILVVTDTEVLPLTVQDGWYKGKTPGMLGFFFTEGKYLACDTSEKTEPQNWLRTDFINFGGAKRIFISINYTLRKCNKRSPNCKEKFQLYSAQTTKSAAAPIPPNEFDFVATASPTNIKEGVPDERNMTSLNATIEAKMDGFYLAFFDQGACFTLYGIKIVSFYCPEELGYLELVSFPKIVSPADDKIPLQVEGSCSDSNAKNTTALIGVCSSKGLWRINKETRCLCKPGYGYEDKRCVACGSYHYKRSFNNTDCKPCPLGSYPLSQKTFCKCNSGLHRLDEKDSDEPCLALPSGPKFANTTSWNSSSILVTWPMSLNKDISYTIKCFICKTEKDKKCVEPCNGKVVFSPGQSGLKGRVSVSGLPAGTNFKFHVYGVNKLNDKVDMSKWNFASTYGKTKDEKATNTRVPEGSDKDVALPVLASIVAVLLVIIVVSLVVVYLLRRKKMKRKRLKRLKRLQHKENLSTKGNYPNIPASDFHHQAINLSDIPGETSSQYAHLLESSRTSTLWELPRHNVSVIKRLGSGNFGYVDKAVAIGLYGHPGQVTVAVKTLKENAGQKDKNDFLTELHLMTTLRPHPRVVELLGCCTRSPGPMSIILEYLPYGDLLGYLRRSRGHEDMHCSGDLRPEGKQTSHDLLQFAWMIADGMSFLAQNNCVHRDLAARNVLVGENKICKISDLGLARTIGEDVYTRSKAARLPIKWMPPESLFHAQSSIASDVWSYGIVLWEIFTLGDSPYPNYKGKDIPRLVQQGYRMPKPLHLSDTLYSLMLRCWQDKPEDRPSFSLICDEINTYYNSTQDYINLDVFDDALYVNFDPF